MPVIPALEEVEAGRSELQSHLWLHSKLQSAWTRDRPFSSTGAIVSPAPSQAFDSWDP